MQYNMSLKFTVVAFIPAGGHSLAGFDWQMWAGQKKRLRAYQSIEISRLQQQA